VAKAHAHGRINRLLQKRQLLAKGVVSWDNNIWKKIKCSVTKELRVEKDCF